MTFLANVLTKDDINNSMTTTSNNWKGTPTDTTGYNSLIVNVDADTNSNPGGLIIQFNSDASNFGDADNPTKSTIFYSDTVIANALTANGAASFVKTYPILKQYYRITYQSSATGAIINCRLSTQAYSSGAQNSISTFDNGEENIYDAFGKLRVSYPNTIIDIRIPGEGNIVNGTTGFTNNYLEICQGSTGTGTTGMTGQNGSLILGVTGSAKLTSQSRKYCVYQPGKSLLFMASGLIGYTASTTNYGYKNRIGYFDDHNGAFFEYGSTASGATSMSLVIRKGGSDASTATQNIWNIDKMNGTGPSGLNLNFLKTQLFVIDMEWLGVGRVRFGFYAYGKIRYCHQITNVNGLTGPYTYSINLPVRYEIDGYSTGVGYSTLTQICSTVISEGGYEPTGRPFSVGMTGGTIGNSPSTEFWLLALRGASGPVNNYYHQNILPTQISIASTGTNDVCIYRLRLFLNGADSGITGGWTGPDSSTTYGSLSVAQYTAGNGTSSIPSTANSIIVDQGVVVGKGNTNYSNLSSIFTNLLQITSNVNNNSAVLVLTVQGVLSNGATIYSTMGWTEIY